MKSFLLTLVACLCGLYAVAQWVHYEAAERTAYARGYAAAVDSVRAVPR